ncbi:MAG TPA: YihY/virulence factor BrkB family protein [Aggregatilineales bacterium]|nr:YihY/virulence factor BrkB family protein [Aggregatilineales bacterium]
MRQYPQRLRQRLLVWWEGRSKETRSFADHLLTAVRNYASTGTSRSAALSYYAVFSIFPLTLLIAVLVNQLLGPTVAQEQISLALGFFLPDETVRLIRDNVVEALDQGGGFTIIAVIGLIWSGLGLFSNLSGSLEAIFRTKKARNLWQSRLVAIFMAVILLLLIILSFITSGLLRLLGLAFPGVAGQWLTIGSLFLPFTVNMLIFVMMFRYIPRARVYWEVIWPIAILGSIGWELAKALFGWYLSNFSNYAVVYGSIATVIVLLLAAYLTASVVILSAEVCARLNEWFEKYHAGRHSVTINQPLRLRSPRERTLPERSGGKR